MKKSNNTIEKNKSGRKPAGKKIVPKPPRFNIMWLYLAIIIGLLVVQYFFSGSSAKQINYQRFESQMLKPHDVEKLVAFKSNDLVTVEVYIKKDRLSQPKYNDVQKQDNLNMSGEGPQSHFAESSLESLQAKLKAAEKDIPLQQRTPLSIDSRESPWAG